jgi:hypothetical protein
MDIRPKRKLLSVLMAFVGAGLFLYWCFAWRQSETASRAAGGEARSSNSEDINLVREQAYQRLIQLIEQERLEPRFWFPRDDNTNYSITGDLVKALLKDGANTTPFIVEKLRNETNMLRLRVDEQWLYYVAKIGLTPRSSSGSIPLPELRDQFIREWDSGLYKDPSGRIAAVADQFRGDPSAGRTPGRIDYSTLNPLKYYGVFGIPALIQQLREHNSVQFYAAFQAVTHVGPNDYGKLYKEVLTAHDEKLAVVKQWWAENSSKFNQLHPLYENIGREVKAIP